MDLHFRHADHVTTVSVEPSVTEAGDPGFSIRIGDRQYQVVVRRHHAGRIELTVDGRRVHGVVAREGTCRLLQIDGHDPIELEHADSPRVLAHAGVDAEDTLSATTPGQVVSVEVAEGDAVERGATLIVLEAMKMEFRLAAPHDGTVTHIHCQAGEVVERGRVLIQLERSDV